MDNAVARYERRQNILVWVWLAVGLVIFAAVIDVILIAGRRLITGTWGAYWSFNDVLARFGFHVMPKIGNLAASFVFLIALFGIFGVASEIKDSGTISSASAPSYESESLVQSKPFRLPRFVWPQTLNERPSGFVRAGRVVHWTALVLAALMLFFGLWAWLDSLGNPHRPPDDGVMLVGVIGALISLLLGRAARYIFANE